MGLPTGFPGVWLFAMALPGNGLAKAQGLNQLVILRVLAAQVTPAFVEFGVPPAAYGSPTRNARRVLAPLAPELFGVTVNGLPVMAKKTGSRDHPPTSSFTTPPRFTNLRPWPNGR